MTGRARKLCSLFTRVRRPLPALLDRLGLRRNPYSLALRDGTQLEIRPRTGDLIGFCEIVLRGDYFACGQTLAHGQTVIDVGANIGCFTVIAAKRVGPTGKVFAIEPETSTFRQLQRNIALNDLHNVVALPIALGGTDGEIVLHAHPTCLFSSIYTAVDGRSAFAGTPQMTVVTTLQRLLATHRIARCHYLKLDCEGAEHDIVAAMSHDTARCIDAITLEAHTVPGHDLEVLQQRLQRLGYRQVGTSKLLYYERTHASVSAS